MMSDDTTTWLKKNSTINPLRRSLKTSLRFHVPNSDMNTSIMSNPDKVKDQGLFIPRMLKRASVQVRKSRVQEFKVPDMVVSKPVIKKEPLGSGVKHKRIPTPTRSRKSLLPVPKTKTAAPAKVSTKKDSLPRPSFAPVSGRRTTAKRDLIKKVVELSEIKRKEESQMKIVSGDSSILRSILKKRASLRRSSQISSKKPKAKKVLFDGFECSDGEKENNANLSLNSQNDFNAVLEEPTVFLNFPNGTNVYESSFEFTKPLNWTVKDSQTNDINHILKLWESYKENINNMQAERNSLEHSFELFLKQSLSFQKQYETYKEASEEMYSKLSQLGEEMEEKLKKVMAKDSLETGDAMKNRRSGVKRGCEKTEKIKMSGKSKIIKKSSGRKSVPLLKKEIIGDLEDSFFIISSSSFLDN